MKEISLAEMQRLELDLLLAFDAVCKKHRLRYYIDGGTLLGAMCYEGFIPWDDDIDLKMPRPDYEAFLKLAAELPAHVAMEIPLKHRCPHLFLKLTDTRTVLLEQAGDRINRSGVYIDILPMDGHPEDGPAYAAHLRKLSRYNTLFHASQSKFKALRHGGSLAKRCKGLLYSAIYSPWRLYRRLTKTAMKYEYDSCSRVGLLVEGDPIRERFEKAWLEPPIELEFAGHCFSAPPGYRRHLELFYGKHVTSRECYHNLPQYPSSHNYEVYWKESVSS